MSEKELKFDSSDPPAYNHANVYNVDLEKGLPLYTPKDINKTSNSTSVKAKQSKKTIITEFDSFNDFFTDFRKKTDHYFPENVVVKSKSMFFFLILGLSFLCTLAISYRFELFSFLKQVYMENGYSLALLGPLGIWLVIWAIFFALFYALIWPFILTIRIAAKVIIFIVVGLGEVLGWFVGAIFWGIYNITVFGLGMKFESSAENTGSPTLPRYQQRDDALAPPPTTTNEEIELQSNPTTQS
ncbi:hypothetical protein SPOG_05767 [Schizosaccharomyces cryophilus OY26]|uniref:Uncharacterized protein n=1 Tax=Schizosaccharomyces cryophilus (strain OY26 / ATCC MYA-4695 / CBS 11777 / NBRC 106824 / NRRL Y48691) TaxID=653667 RepID=S9WYS1_SCHCR|nr:uncharacterized protein SPOG_05765 [Schizosaccharomyces cryophilus OY26]XP_013025464.1 uncharacterized protein SPOG_05767 [Schizosaccharomyces cryophilus OY26]EPY49762.1 hypothetical protein SPOG_05765 [Schizosaccharomyces cryophilus OY26]EPY49822.1 hypothetical protein SPOG_05767 [Schizosaccharomyces cryophilus OY26]